MNKFSLKNLFEPDVAWVLPEPEIFPQSQFAAKRKHDIHTGIDIFVVEGTSVYSVDCGVIINIEWFTGELASPPSPWWNNTQAIWIQNKNLPLIVYGEIKTNLEIGYEVQKGEQIGTISTVLKTPKINSASMLHLEMYDGIPPNTAIWNLNESKPNQLLNPKDYIL